MRELLGHGNNIKMSRLFVNGLGDRVSVPG